MVTQAYNDGFSQLRDYADASTYGVIILSMLLLLLLFSVFWRRILARGQAAVA